ncbi:MAG: hypothetical protein ACLQBB_02150 [Solirubrobacteraceae bacterium]
MASLLRTISERRGVLQPHQRRRSSGLAEFARGNIHRVRGVIVSLLLTGVAIGSMLAPAHPLVRARPAAATPVWSQPTLLVPADEYAFDPQLAVSEGGATLAAWFGGPEPPPARAGGAASNASGSSSAGQPAWSGSSVVVDTGTASGGFGAPAVLAEHAADTNDGLDVAISGSGVRYIAWQSRAGGWMIASAAPGEGFTSAHALPVPLIQLLASPAGPVAAVWHIRATLHYALLTKGGGLGRVVEVPGRFERVRVPVALNDRGAFATVENTAELAATSGPHPIVYLCEPSGHCTAPHPLKMGHPPAGSEENDALALSDDGTLTVLAAFSKPPRHPAANTPWGLWSSTRRPDGRWSAPQQISDGGESPLAAGDGQDAAVTVFQHFWTPKLHWLKDRIEISVLHAPRDRFAPPHPVRGAEAPEPAALATTTGGGLLVAWTNSGHIVGGESSEPGVYAVTGNAVHPGAPQCVASGAVGGQTPAAGIDRSRQAVILWTGSTETPYRTSGVYASFFGGR